MLDVPLWGILAAMRTLCVYGLLAGVVGLAVGQKATAPPTGVVTGHVVLEDTQRPGRLVTVSLVRKPAEREATTAKGKEVPTQQLISTKTGLDGSFTFSAAPLGEYWVVAQREGYVLPFMDVATEEEQKSAAKVMANFPSVLVTAERPAESNISLRRGGVVSGRMRFDDGTAVPGVTLTLMPSDKLRGSDSRSFIVLNQIARANEFKTDDVGAFRISGVAPGRYHLVATMPVFGGSTVVGTRSYYSMGSGNEVYLSFYPPGTLHKAASPVLEIKSGEEVADDDITVNLSSMHTVTGRVISKEDQHLLNEGTVYLKDQSDKDLSYSSIVNLDGRFYFPYVPEGNFELALEGAGDAAEPADPGQPWNRKTLQSYAGVKVPVTVSNQDVTVPDVVLAPKKPAKSGDTAATNEN